MSKAAKAETKRAADALRSSKELGKDSDDSNDSKQIPKHRKTDGSSAAVDGDFMEEVSEPATAKQFSDLMNLMANNRTEDDARWGRMSTMMHSFENKFTLSDAHLARVDDTLAKLQARLDDFDKRAPPPGGAGPSGSAPSAGSAWFPIPAAASRSPPRSSPAAAPDFYKVFFVGADHAIGRAALGRFWNASIRPLVAPSLTAHARPFVGNSASFSVGFLSDSAAKDFLIALDAAEVPQLVESDGHKHTFTYHFQRSKTPTKFGKQLSYLHKHYYDKLKDRDGFDTDFKLVTDAHRGRTYIEKDERVILLHSINSDGATLRTFDAGLTEFKLDIAESHAAALLFAAA
jgi:hypothetical protein